jgi:hypothetical protein
MHPDFVQAFALDHLNDVVVNSAGLGGALLGQFVAWWTGRQALVAGLHQCPNQYA